MLPEFDEYREEAPRSRLKSCVLILISVLIILALLGSSIIGLISLIQARLDVEAVEDTTNERIPTLVVELTAAASTTTAAPPTAVSQTPIPPTAADPLGVNRIAFIDANRQVTTINPDGTGARSLTDASQTYRFPVWSPNSEALAVISDSREGSAVYLLNDEEQAPERELYFSEQESPIYLYWSPDGRYLSFIAGHATEGIGLHLAALEEEESRLLATGQPFYWQWTADAQQLLIHTGFSGADARLALITPDGDGSGENIAAPGFFQSPGVSTDGRYWAYAEEVTDGASWLVVADTQTGELTREQHGGQIAMGWHPTQNQLAFISGEEDTLSFWGPLRLFDAETSQTRLLSRDLVLAFFWSPDGRYLAYITPTGGESDDIQAGQPGDRREMGKQNQQQRGLEFKLVVVDMATGDGLQLATFEPTLIFVTQFLPFFDQYALSHRLWSPDSQALVLPMQLEDEARIFVIPVGGSRPREIAEGSIAFWSQR